MSSKIDLQELHRLNARMSNHEWAATATAKELLALVRAVRAARNTQRIRPVHLTEEERSSYCELDEALAVFTDNPMA